MNIALIGASGFIGSAILKELLARNHQVTALVGHPEKLTPQSGLTAIASDVQNVATLTTQLAGFDAVISAFSGHAQSDTYAYYLAGIKNIMAASSAAQNAANEGVQAQRLLVVGGAGSLEVAEGVQLIDTEGFPDIYKATAEGARQALNLLKAEAELNWTILSPSAMIAPGTRTTKFRTGLNQLLKDANGNSHISVEDFAVAMVDELETPKHLRQRFTVGY
jgi:hypothetical protein